MSQYSWPQPDQGGVPVGEARICGNCGGRVSTHDHYCSSCGCRICRRSSALRSGSSTSRLRISLCAGIGLGFRLHRGGTIVTAVFWLLVGIAFRLATRA